MMKCNYHPETDSLFIHFSEGQSADSTEVRFLRDASKPPHINISHIVPRITPYHD